MSNEITEKDVDLSLAVIEKEENKLLPVKDPTTVATGSIDIDAELFIIARNLKVLVRLKLFCGREYVKLERDYNKETMQLTQQLTKADLSEIGVTATTKFKYIKTLLHKECHAYEDMKIKYRYFADMYNCYVEYINVYKKTRVIPEGIV